MTDPPMRRPEPSPSGELSFDRFATSVLLVVATALAACSQVQPDFWWLLRAGKDIWHTGRVPLVDHYSYTAAGRDWPNHEWLWEATAYGLHHVGGMPLVALATAAVVCLTLRVILGLTAATGYVVPLVLAATIPLLSVSWTTRPQVTSLLLFAVTMLLLGRERHWLVPPLFLVWANLHAQVVMGGVLLATATGISALRWLRLRTEEERARTMRLALVTVVSAAATLVNPLGPGLWRYVLGANGRPGQHAIQEWHNAFELTPATVWFWAVAALVVVVALRRPERLRGWPAQVVVAGTLAMAPLAVLAIRNIPFFVVAAAPLLMTLLEFRTERAIGTVPRARQAVVASATLAALVVAAAWSFAPSALGWRPVPRGLQTAVRACPGHLFNGYEAGAALIWWVPDVKVFVDNRQDPYPAAVIDSLFATTRTGYRHVFGEYDVMCALTASDDPLGSYLQQDGWRATYVDRTESLWVPPSTPRATSATE